MSHLNLNLVPQHIKDAVEREYASCEDLGEMAARLGITLNRLYNIAHAMHVHRDKALVGKRISHSSTIHRRNMPQP